MSAAFERFRYSFFDDPMSARDGLDLAALRELAGDERARAVEMLIDVLPDTRAVIGLGELRAREAEPFLAQILDAEEQEYREALATPGADRPADKRTYVAKALWQVRPDPRWLATLIDALAHGSEWTERMHAAEALFVAPDPIVVEPLKAALDDENELVRHHAARALLHIHGLPADAGDRDHFVYRIMSDDPARREAGKRDILAAVAGRVLAAR